MTTCERLSDRMPDVALGRSEWTPEEEVHLGSCSECLAEWSLVRAAQALDRGAPTLLDTSTLADAVQRRLREDRAERVRTRRVWSVASVAAAAAVLLGVLLGRPEEATRPEPRMIAEAEALLPLPELEGLETAQLDTLLRSIDGPVGDGSALEATTLGEPDGGELEQAFAAWEG